MLNVHKMIHYELQQRVPHGTIIPGILDLLDQDTTLMDTQDAEYTVPTSFLENSTVSRYVNTVMTHLLARDPDLSADVPQFQATSLFHMYKFRAAGAPVVKPTNRLLAALDDTNLPKAFDPKLFKLPFTSMYVVLPQEYKSHLSSDVFEGSLRGIYFEMNTAGVLRYLLDVYITGYSEVGHVLGGIGYVTLDKPTLLECCTQDPTNEGARPLLLLLMKLMMYMTSMNTSMTPVRPPRAKYKKAKYLKKQASSRPFYDVDLIVPNKSRSTGESTMQGGTHTYRYLVQGHWHRFWMLSINVPSGVTVLGTRKNKALVSKFVAPFWKGPEFGQVVVKRRRVV